MTAVTFPLRPPRIAFAICGWRWQNDVYETKYSVWLLLILVIFFTFNLMKVHKIGTHEL